MTKGYWVAQVDVDDPEAYKVYVGANGAALAKYGGRFLTRGGEAVVAEGKVRSRIVVIEFPSYQAACDCWNSQEYTAAKALRSNISQADVVIVAGYSGPQPSSP